MYEPQQRAYTNDELNVVLDAGVSHVGAGAHGGVPKAGEEDCGHCPHPSNDCLQRHAEKVNYQYNLCCYSGVVEGSCCKNVPRGLEEQTMFAQQQEATCQAVFHVARCRSAEQGYRAESGWQAVHDGYKGLAVGVISTLPLLCCPAVLAGLILQTQVKQLLQLFCVNCIMLLCHVMSCYQAYA